MVQALPPRIAPASPGSSGVTTVAGHSTVGAQSAATTVSMPLAQSVLQAPYTLKLPPQVLWGHGRFADLGIATRPYGPLAYLISGARSAESSGLLREAKRLLDAVGVEVTVGKVEREPEVEEIDRLTRAARDMGATVIIGLGGGSALDAAKTVAALVTNGGSALDYLETIGSGKKLESNPLPFIAVPTTAGTGSEATRNSVILSKTHNVKRSFRDDRLMARVAILDPELTRSAPRHVTLAAGLDALTQLIESYISARANAFTDALALDGIRRVWAALPRVAAEPGNDAARAQMLHGAFLSGVTLSNAGLGAVHGIAPALGAVYGIAHGFACSTILPAVLQVNIDRMVREPGPSLSTRRQKASVLANTLTGRPCSAHELTEAITSALIELYRAIGAPTLADIGVTPDRFDDVVAKSRGGSSMAANPVELSDADLRRILDQALNAPWQRRTSATGLSMPGLSSPGVRASAVAPVPVGLRPISGARLLETSQPVAAPIASAVAPSVVVAPPVRNDNGVPVQPVDDLISVPTRSSPEPTTVKAPLTELRSHEAPESSPGLASLPGLD